MSARFVYRPLSAGQMATIGNFVIADIQLRLSRALNVNDSPAKPLSMRGKRYQRYYYVKKAKGLDPIRNLSFTGETLADMRVIDARSNMVRIGFATPRSSRIAAINQAREPWGWFSPHNQRTIGQLVTEAIRSSEMVSIQRTA